MSWFKSKKEKLAENLYDEQVYENVAAEIANKEIWPGLWTKAFAQTNGNEQQAKAIYIKLRAEQIKLGHGAYREFASDAVQFVKAIVKNEAAQESPEQYEDRQICKYCRGSDISTRSDTGTPHWCFSCKKNL